MQTQVDIQDIIKRLMAGQPVDNYSMARDTPQFNADDDAGRQKYADGTLTGYEDGFGANTGVNYKDPSKEWYKSYGMDGQFLNEGDGKNRMTAKDFAIFAAIVASMGAAGGLVGGAGSLGGGGMVNGAFLGEGVASGIGAWDAALLNAGGSLGGAAGAFDAGGDLVDFTTGGGGPGSTPFNPGLDPLGFGPDAGSLGMGGLGGPATSFGLDPSLFGDMAAGGASGGGFMDKLGTWASDPANLLKGVGTIGGLYEAFNGKNPGDFTQTANKTLDPRIDSAMFGPGGLLGQIKDFGTANPGGMNDAMRTGQNGLLGMASNPGVLDGFNRLGANGLGLLGRGIASNPWLTKAGG